MLEALLQLLEGLVVLGIQGAVCVLVMVLAVVHRTRFRARWRAGAVLGLACFVLALPGGILGLLSVDPNVMLREHPVPISPLVFKVGFYAGMVLGFIMLVLKIGWVMVAYVVAASEWERLRPGVFRATPPGSPFPMRGVLLAVLFGVGAGMASAWLFDEFRVSQSQFLEQMQAYFPGFKSHPSWLVYSSAALSVTEPAISEEMLFRGCMLAFLLRVTGRNSFGIFLSIVLVSLLWGTAHLLNTNEPLWKVTQIFLIGVVFCGFMLRSSLEAAIAGHVALNLTAVLYEFSRH